MKKIPYITKGKRSKFNNYIIQIENMVKRDPASLCDSNMAYIIYKLLIDVYGKDFYGWDIKADALKVLEDVKLEYYRRVLVPHADRKIKENGDI